MSRPDGDGEGRAIPYMLENTPEEFERVRNLAWPAAPAAEADLREQIARLVKVFDDAELPGTSLGIRHYERIADALLALPALQRLVAEAAEARRLRETVAELAKELAAEATDRKRIADRLPDQPAYRMEINRLVVAAEHQQRCARKLRRALDGTDG